MKRNAEDVRVGGEEAGLGKRENVAVLQLSPLAADDIVTVLSQGPPDCDDDEWRGPGPDALAFLENIQCTLRLER